MTTPVLFDAKPAMLTIAPRGTPAAAQTGATRKRHTATARSESPTITARPPIVKTSDVPVAFS
jgi:hypothetical protein